MPRFYDFKSIQKKQFEKRNDLILAKAEQASTTERKVQISLEVQLSILPTVESIRLQEKRA